MLIALATLALLLKVKRLNEPALIVGAGIVGRFLKGVIAPQRSSARKLVKRTRGCFE